MKLSKPKYIFVTGGVASSLGKGIFSASIARLLQARGYSVTIQKLDPYILSLIHILLVSITRPLQWAETEMPPPMWATTRFRSS